MLGTNKGEKYRWIRWARGPIAALLALQLCENSLTPLNYRCIWVKHILHIVGVFLFELTRTDDAPEIEWRKEHTTMDSLKGLITIMLLSVSHNNTRRVVAYKDISLLLRLSESLVQVCSE